MNIYVRSFTQAQKARDFLSRRGIRCMIERTQTRGKGCGFMLHITGSHGGTISREEVCSLLGEIGIDCDIS